MNGMEASQQYSLPLYADSGQSEQTTPRRSTGGAVQHVAPMPQAMACSTYVRDGGPRSGELSALDYEMLGHMLGVADEERQELGPIAPGAVPQPTEQHLVQPADDLVQFLDGVDFTDDAEVAISPLSHERGFFCASSSSSLSMLADVLCVSPEDRGSELFVDIPTRQFQPAGLLQQPNTPPGIAVQEVGDCSVADRRSEQAPSSTISITTTFLPKYWKNDRKNLQCFPACLEHGDYGRGRIEALPHPKGICRAPVKAKVDLHLSGRFEPSRLIALARLVPSSSQRFFGMGMSFSKPQVDELCASSSRGVVEHLHEDDANATTAFDLLFYSDAWRLESRLNGKRHRDAARSTLEIALLYRSSTENEHVLVGETRSEPFEVGNVRTLVRHQGKREASANNKKQKKKPTNDHEASQAESSSQQPFRMMNIPSRNAEAKPPKHKPAQDQPTMGQLLRLISFCLLSVIVLMISFAWSALTLVCMVLLSPFSQSPRLWLTPISRFEAGMARIDPCRSVPKALLRYRAVPPCRSFCIVAGRFVHFLGLKLLLVMLTLVVSFVCLVLSCMLVCINQGPVRMRRPAWALGQVSAQYTERLFCDTREEAPTNEP